jgi:hypothetical protein
MPQAILDIFAVADGARCLAWALSAVRRTRVAAESL